MNVYYKGYRYRRGPDLGNVMSVFRIEDSKSERLLPDKSRELLDLSESFDFYYDGPATSQLSLAILLDATDKDMALKYYEEFKARFLLGQFSLQINADQVKRWVEATEAYHHIKALCSED